MKPLTAAALCALCYNVTALLVLLPNTVVFRLMLMPVTLCLALQGATYDAVKANDDLRLNWLNYDMGVESLFFSGGLGSTLMISSSEQLAMLIMSMRVLDWTFRREPLRRISAGSTGPRTLLGLLKDTIDLVVNQRGIGWTWSRGYKPPSHTRPISSTPRFLLYTLTSALVHHIVGESVIYGIQLIDWDNFTNPYGASLFNSQLPPIPRYLLSTFISLLAGMVVYCVIQTLYDVTTLMAVIFLNHSPSKWPPLFDSPWRATTIADFWGARWHQMFRQVFLQIGVKPLYYITGQRSIALLGGFVISGLLHDWGMWGMTQGTNFPMVGGYFIMQGVGVIIERTVLKKAFGGKVDGWKGWIWTMSWTVIWANLVVEVWFRQGLLATRSLPDEFRPPMLVQRLRGG